MPSEIYQKADFLLKLFVKKAVEKFKAMLALATN